MKSIDLETGRRFREEGEVAEALRCFQAALEDDRDSIEIYIELALTYILAFEESGDPLCLDSARKVCISALRRQPEELERRRLFRIQTQIEDLLLESQKAEMDAMADALHDGAIDHDWPSDDEPVESRDEDDPRGEGSSEDRGH